VIPAFLRRSLVLRTTLVVLAVALLVGGLAQTAANRLVRQWEAERRRLTLEALLDVVAPSAAVAGFAQDQTLAQQVVDGLIGTPMVHGAAIRTSGQLLVQAQRESPLPGPAETYVRVLMSPFDPKTRIGELVLTPDPWEAARREAAEVALTRLTLAGLGLAMGLAVAAALHGLVLAPITGLIHRLHGLQVDSGGRLATPRGHEEDEIGRLVADVNGLVQRLTDALWKEQELYRRMAEDKRRTEKDAEPVGVFLVDPAGALEAWNPAFAALLGLDAAPPAPGTRFPPLFDGAARQVEDCLARCRAGTAPAAATLRLECRDGATRWLQLALHRLAPEGGPDGGPGWCQGLLDDVSRRYHEPSPAGMPELKDAATGVLNRLGAEYGLGQLLDGKARGMAVLALELALAPGTAVDPLLPEAAERITATLRQGTLVARLEAGRFLVVLEPLEDPEAALGVARKLAEALDPPFRIAEGGIARATVAIGLVMRRPGVPELPRILIERAELALVQAHSALLGPRSSINRQ
jgi:PAS domain-containing protein/GGDEF domain-containing protein